MRVLDGDLDRVAEGHGALVDGSAATQAELTAGRAGAFRAKAAQADAGDGAAARRAECVGDAGRVADRDAGRREVGEAAATAGVVPGLAERIAPTGDILGPGGPLALV